MKRLVLQICSAVGVFRLFSWLNRNKVAILFLHQVMEDDGKQPYVPLRPVMTPDALDRAIEAVSRYYNFVTVEEAVAMIAGKIPVKPRSVAITFDDGYRNNLTHALPILEKYSAPFMIYLTVGHIDRRVPMWVDRLDYALTKYNGEPVRRTFDDKEYILDGDTDLEKADAFQRFRRAAKRVECEDREFLQTIDDVASELESGSCDSLTDVWEVDDWSALLSWEDINKNSSELVSYGSHTINHTRLARSDIETVKQELLESRATIEQRTGIYCSHFAYPDGSFNDEVSRIVADLGYESAVTTEEGINKVGADLFQLRRTGVPLDGEPLDVLPRVTGAFVFFSSVKKFFTGA